jgi:hypothetical protein
VMARWQIDRNTESALTGLMAVWLIHCAKHGFGSCSVFRRWAPMAGWIDRGVTRYES